MKRIFKPAVAVLALGLTVAAFAASPRFATKNDGGNSSGGAEVIFRSSPGEQTRIVNVLYQSDTNNAQLSFTAGTTVYNIAATNTSSTGVTNQFYFTNGLAAASVLVVEHLGVPYVGTISTIGSNATFGAFAVLTSGGFGVATSVGDPVYLMSSATTVPVGSTTNALSGYAIFAADSPGRPVRVVLTPALATNRLNSVSAIYE